MDVPLPEDKLTAPAVGQADPSVPFRDRSTGLVVFGIILIVLAGFALLAIPLFLVGAVVSRKAGGSLPAGNYVLNAGSYAAAAIVLFILGIGSIRAQRWARALVLVTSWVWLIGGVLGTVLLTAVLPGAMLAGLHRAAASGSGQAIPTGMLAVILTVVIAFFAVFFVVLPIAFVVFYRQKDVEMTCRHRHPEAAWTDRAPLPVLAASVLFTAGSGYYLLMSVALPMFPFFGRYITGLPAGICLFLNAVLDAYLAYALFRRQLTGWWIAVCAACLHLVSAAATFHRADLMQAYAKMGWSQEQLQVMSANPGIRSGVFLWWSLAFVVLWVGYLVWLKRYFKSEDAATGTLPPAESPLS